MPHPPRFDRLRRFIAEVWNLGDEGAVARYVAAQYTIHHDPGDPWAGRTLDLAGYRDRLTRSRAPFPDQTFDIRHIAACEDDVIITWLWRATHLADIAGFPASGREIRMSGATVYSFDAEDRLTGHWQISDRLGVFEQLSAR